MYIKWIVCRIKDHFEKEFSDAQEQWIETQNSVGFIGQVGGWDLNQNKTACIISFWENESSLIQFMKNIHDNIFFNNSQSKYYNSIEVAYFDSGIKMEGNFDSFIDILNTGKVLQIDDFVVKKEKSVHFETVKNNIWLPGIKQSKRLLGDDFPKVSDKISRYLVSTFWESLSNHEKQIKKQFPKYRNESDVNNDINKGITRTIQLVDSWKIIKINA